MPRAQDFTLLSPNLALWQIYDPKAKADLYSTAIETKAGLFLVDPVPLEHEAGEKLVAGRAVAGIVVTNANHCRTAAAWADQFDAPVLAHPATCTSCEFLKPRGIGGGEKLAPDLRVIEIEGAAPGEIALYQDAADGTVIVGDALINFEPYGFTFLPAKYCEDAPRMRRSLHQLLDCKFDRMLFAHGTPLLTGARQRLGQLLNNG